MSRFFRVSFSLVVASAASNQPPQKQLWEWAVATPQLASEVELEDGIEVPQYYYSIDDFEDKENGKSIFTRQFDRYPKIKASAAFSPATADTSEAGVGESTEGESTEGGTNVGEYCGHAEQALGAWLTKNAEELQNAEVTVVYSVGREAGDTEKSLRIHTEFSSFWVFCLAY